MKKMVVMIAVPLLVEWPDVVNVNISPRTKIA